MAALASPWRIEIVRLLADDELDVTDIAQRLGLPVANTTISAAFAKRGW